MLPAVAGIRFSTARAKVDLPQPDSPTTPSVSPAWMSKEMPSTAFRVRAADQGQAPPLLILKCTFRSRTDKMGWAASRMNSSFRRKFGHSFA
jgi:hypothetical protein